MVAGLISLMISIAAAGLVYYSWRQHGKAWAAATGWLLAFGSAFAWSAALGPEFGVSYAIIAFVGLTWTAVAFNVEAPKALSQSVIRPIQRMNWPSLQACFKHGLLFMLAVPVAGTIAIFSSLLLVQLLPWSKLNQVTLAIFLLPVLWGGLSAWICAETKQWVSILLCCALLVITSFALFMPL